MIYYIDIERKKRNTAGAKAPDDIAKLCKSKEMQRFAMPMFPHDRGSIYQKLWLIVICSFYWIKLRYILHEGDIVIYQHPMYGNRIAEKMIPIIQKAKNSKFVVIIHDLESLRKGIEGVIKNNSTTNQLADNIMLKHFDKIICHNEHMKRYLISQGFEESKLISLEIFDYLTDCKRKQPSKGMHPSCAIAGNLAKGKCSYIYKIFDSPSSNKMLRLHLYGNSYEEEYACSNMIYHGSFKPEELPEHLEGDFGLVWDGTSADTCMGNTGYYLKYNNPHKVSLYLASNMPVIVWKHAAIADFVLKNGVGIVVESLYELEDAITRVTINDYRNMCKNVKKISSKLRRGYFFSQAIDKI